MSLIVSFALLLPLATVRAAERPPNNLVIVADVLGYADVRFNPLHPTEVATQHLAALAKETSGRIQR